MEIHMTIVGTREDISISKNKGKRKRECISGSVHELPKRYAHSPRETIMVSGRDGCMLLRKW